MENCLGTLDQKEKEVDGKEEEEILLLGCGAFIGDGRRILSEDDFLKS